MWNKIKFKSCLCFLSFYLSRNFFPVGGVGPYFTLVNLQKNCLINFRKVLQLQLHHGVSPRLKHIMSIVQNIAKIVADTTIFFSPCYLASGIAEALYHHESESLDWLVAAVAAQLSTPATSVTINLKLCQCRDHPALGGNNQTKYLSLVHVKYFW